MASNKKAPAGYSRGERTEFAPFSQTIALLCSSEARR
jgi:hypothetical protein